MPKQRRGDAELEREPGPPIPAPGLEGGKRVRRKGEERSELSRADRVTLQEREDLLPCRRRRLPRTTPHAAQEQEQRLGSRTQPAITGCLDACEGNELFRAGDRDAAKDVTGIDIELQQAGRRLPGAG